MLTRIDMTRTANYQLGLEKGLETGMETGIEKGIQKGEARLLQKMLRLKFGQLPPEIEEQLFNTDSAQIEQWSERVLNAATLDEVMN